MIIISVNAVSSWIVFVKLLWVLPEGGEFQLRSFDSSTID